MRGVLAAAVAATVAASGLAACGTGQPQAPLAAAKRLDHATSGISTACGLAYQLAAFPRRHRKEMITLQVTAATAADSIAAVYRRNPAWVYQGETIGQIVADSESMLGACGLASVRRALERATRGRRRVR